MQYTPKVQRSFDADINTVVTVYSPNKKEEIPVQFLRFNSYTDHEVKQYYSFESKDLKPGKWFYLRPSKFYYENILPKLTSTVNNFAITKFGVKTGANDFFFLRDVGEHYESDYLANQKSFRDIGLTITDKAGLDKLGLMYIENEGGHRFVINKEDVVPIIRSPTELDSYLIKKTSWFVFKPRIPNKPGNFSRRYIKWGERQTAEIKRGKDAGKNVIGYNNLTSTQSHRPNWFNIQNLDAAPIIANKFIFERHFVSLCPTKVLADHTCDLVYPSNIDETTLWLTMNSTIFLLVKELYGLRMGGAALQILTEEFGEYPFPNLENFHYDEKLKKSFEREPLRYDEELKNVQRMELDRALAEHLGISADMVEIYNAFLEAVQDRLVKSGRTDNLAGADRI